VCDLRMKDGPGKNARAHKTMYRGIHVWLWLWLSGVVGRGEGELDGGTVVADGSRLEMLTLVAVEGKREQHGW
jgi:hypothetical protein